MLELISAVLYFYTHGKIKASYWSEYQSKLIVDIATGETPDPIKELKGKNPASVELGRLSGLKGGKERVANLSAKKRSEISKKAAKMRWREIG